MNTHPTHTQVGGWGLQPTIVPIDIGDVLLLLLCVCFFGAWVFLLVLVGVWWEFNAFLSNLKYIGILGFIFA